MSNDYITLEMQNIVEQYQGYYEQRILSLEPCWNDAVFRMDIESTWLDTTANGISQKTRIKNIFGQNAWEEYFSFVEKHLEQGNTLPVEIVRCCAEQDAERMLALLQRCLPEAFFLMDWDAPCSDEINQGMDRFAEAIQLMECIFPVEFAKLCLHWIEIVPLENEYIPELLLKGIIHTAEERLPALLQTESLHNGIKIGLLNYICESSVRHEAIFTILKSMFKQNQDPDEKHFLGILLGDYGDSRAIPVLRKYLENLLQSAQANPQDMQEIASAIYKLGGQYEDLMHNYLPLNIC